MLSRRDLQLITGMNVREYFHDAIFSAMVHQHIESNDETVIYVVNLLTNFTRSENIYEETPEGTMIKPLALIYREAQEAPTTEEQNKTLQRLGDIALFISGLFASSLNRSLVGIDYFIAMGGNAYGSLANTTRKAFNGEAVSNVFAELSDRFLVFVDILSEVGDKTELSGNSEIMRLYETWLQTGSQYACKRLHQLGIQTVPVSNRRN